MPISILITGGNLESRFIAASEIAKKNSQIFDTHLVDTTEEKGIEAAKTVMSKTSQRPFASNLSTIIVKEAQNLTLEAQNSLLKTLEEPAEKSQIILTAPNSDNVLPTIASRCLEIRVEDSIYENSSEVEFETATLNKRLELFEKSNIDELLGFWEAKLKTAVADKSASGKLVKLHRYNKTLLKLKKAEKFAVNKKLLTLIAALEAPIEA